MKDVVVNLSPEAAEELSSLQKAVKDELARGVRASFSRQLLRSLERQRDNLRQNPFCGKHVMRNCVPKHAAARFGTKILWKLDLVGYWRLIYTLRGDDVRIECLVLEFMDHKTYDILFGYRKR